MDLIHLNYPQNDLENATDSETDSSSAEVDNEAPYGRKKNGQPYRTSPAMRKAMNKYVKRKYAEDPKIQYERTRKWAAKNQEKVRKYALDHYYKKKQELQYYKELFELGLEEP